MAKVVKPLLVVAAIAVNVIPGVGQVLSAAMITAITTAGISAGLGIAASVLGLGPKAPRVSPASRERLYVSVDPATPRKVVFGHTALATDIRYQEYTGVNQEYLSEIIHVASHKINGVEAIYFEDKLAWTAAGGAQGEYVGYLTITVRTEGTAGNTVTIGTGSKWGATRRMTGLAYLHVQYKLTGDGKKKESPFAQSKPTRVTIIGEGAPVYDPRFDSTQGGTGPMRANDQTTWAFSYGGVEIGRNPALQLLSWLLGYRIQNPQSGVWRLALGRGLPAARLDLASFITAANACDEPVALATGGTEPRYRADGIFTEADDPRNVIDTYETTMNAKLRDAGGRYSLTVLSNDLGTPRFDFNDNDVLGDFRWTPTEEIERSFNEVRGRFTNPSVQALYQLVDYPRLREVPIDGIERVHTLDLPLIQSGGQAQRIAKQQFARSKYQGRFECSLGYRGWAVQLGDPVRLTFSALGWENRLFRVVEHGMRTDGVVPVVLQEENADIYLWDADERPVVQPVTLVPYDRTKSVLLQLLQSGQLEYAGGQTLESLKPAEAGADVTGNHTAANANAVGFRTAAIINALLSDLGTAVTALQNADTAFNTSLNNLWAAFGTSDALGFRSRVISVENVNATQATKITGLESTFNEPGTGVLARLGTIEQTQVTDRTAAATRLTALESEITTARYGYASLAAKIGNFAGTFVDALAGKAEATAFTTLSAEITTARGGYGSLSAKFGSVTGTFADALAGKATTATVESLTATVNGHTGSITTLQTVTADVQGKVNASVTLLVDAGGRVAGYRINSSNTEYSTIDFLADHFRFVIPGTALAPFSISGDAIRIHVPLVSFDNANNERARFGEWEE